MLIDAHAHLDKYGSALAAALNETAERQIFTIGTAMDIPSYHKMQRIADQSDLVLATFGIHPKRAPDYVTRLKELSPYIEASPAIGEIGLDFHWIKDASLYSAQRKVLEYFLAAAREQKKIVNLHTKGAEKDILNLLDRYGIQRAIVHWYSGPRDVLRDLAQFGAYFTFGVELLFSEKIRALATEVPDHLLLTETDNPGGLKWLTGISGMPSVLTDVVQALARLRQTREDEMLLKLKNNFLLLIQDDPWLGAVHHLLSQSEH